MIRLESRPRHRDKVIKQETAGTLVLVNLDDGECYGLNEVGGRVWDLCDGTRSVAAVAAAVAEEYDAQGGAVEADVLEILEELARAELVAVQDQD
ncbi:MAG: PqqD family protein [Deinococcota bacterium]|jgi:hypothetical protein|nr:PqqD family protein [Deinococcota bacterium]